MHESIAQSESSVHCVDTRDAIRILRTLHWCVMYYCSACSFFSLFLGECNWSSNDFLAVHSTQPHKVDIYSTHTTNFGCFDFFFSFRFLLLHFGFVLAEEKEKNRQWKIPMKLYFLLLCIRFVWCAADWRVNNYSFSAVRLNIFQYHFCVHECL